jgi:hypothetical protein
MPRISVPRLSDVHRLKLTRVDSGTPEDGVPSSIVVALVAFGAAGQFFGLIVVFDPLLEVSDPFAEAFAHVSESSGSEKKEAYREDDENFCQSWSHIDDVSLEGRGRKPPASCFGRILGHRYAMLN